MLLLAASRPGLGQMVVDPDSLTFGQVPLGGCGEGVADLTNLGPCPLLVDVVQVRGDDFQLPAPPVTAAARLLAPGDTLGIRVRYCPTATRLDTGTILIRAALDSTAVPLLGEGTSVLIDEILADPPSGEEGDANGDGARHSYHDEFIELRNAGSDSVSVGGWRMGDDDAPQ
ncbi:hypothetical protein ACFL6X_06815, partial [Candidatus Latescibacterota bacterium]